LGPLTFVDQQGRVARQEPVSNQRVLKGIVAADKGTRLLGLYDTGDLAVWSQGGTRRKFVPAPHSEVKLADGNTVKTFADPSSTSHQLSVTAQGSIILPIQEKVETYGPDPKQPGNTILLSSHEQITFYPVDKNGSPVKGQ